MYLIKKEDTYKVKPLSELGLEYNDPNLTKEYLYEAIHSKRLPIKTVLLDQSIIAGIGNIYDDEILFMSGIHPLRKASDVSLDECEKIINNTKIVATNILYIVLFSIFSLLFFRNILRKNLEIIHSKH